MLRKLKIFCQKPGCDVVDIFPWNCDLLGNGQIFAGKVWHLSTSCQQLHANDEHFSDYICCWQAKKQHWLKNNIARVPEVELSIHT
jgi:hypothetical protein